jgi:hypothetical protein
LVYPEIERSESMVRWQVAIGAFFPVVAGRYYSIWTVAGGA